MLCTRWKGVTVGQFANPDVGHQRILSLSATKKKLKKAFSAKMYIEKARYQKYVCYH